MSSSSQNHSRWVSLAEMQDQLKERISEEQVWLKIVTINSLVSTYPKIPNFFTINSPVNTYIEVTVIYQLILVDFEVNNYNNFITRCIYQLMFYMQYELVLGRLKTLAGHPMAEAIQPFLDQYQRLIVVLQQRRERIEVHGLYIGYWPLKVALLLNALLGCSDCYIRVFWHIYMTKELCPCIFKVGSSSVFTPSTATYMHV